MRFDFCNSLKSFSTTPRTHAEKLENEKDGKMSSDLQPPTIKTHELEDPGAHELDSSDGSEDFVDASEGQRPSTRTGRPGPSGGSGGDQSPIPVTRVERVDDEPAYGEVPGTTAYKLRTADAVPDEIEVVPEGTRSRSASRVSAGDRPSTPGGTQIPKIIAEKIDPDVPGYGDVPGTAAYEMRRADATPDEIVKSPASDAAPANVLKG